VPIKFYPLNLIIVAVILLPNLFFAIFPPAQSNPSDATIKTQMPGGWNIVIIFEQIGRICVFLLPLFWELKPEGRVKGLILPAIMLVCLIGYYTCWIRYFAGGREIRLLFEPLFFIPVPLAVFPVTYFILAGFLLGSWPMVLAAVVFAASHIAETLRSMHLL